MHLPSGHPLPFSFEQDARNVIKKKRPFRLCKLPGASIKCIRRGPSRFTCAYMRWVPSEKGKDGLKSIDRMCYRAARPCQKKYVFVVRVRCGLLKTFEAKALQKAKNGTNMPKDC